MNTVSPVEAPINHSSRPRGRGQPSKQTRECTVTINRALAQALAGGLELPSDETLAAQLQLSARTVRTIRLKTLGLNHRELRHWRQSARPVSPVSKTGERQLVCSTPFAGLWLLVPQLIDSGLVQAAAQLKRLGRTRVLPTQIVLTLVVWATLSFQRLMHLDDHRHWADLGLALFTGALHLWSDTTVWRWVHGLTPESAREFYDRTAGAVTHASGSHGRFSLDEHVVPSFSKRKPRALGKTRVPTRGRSYPAFRLYVPFDLDTGRFLGLIVTHAHKTLAQMGGALRAELRRLRRVAGLAQPEVVRLIMDRGAYKGTWFETLLDDPQVSFIAIARATQVNVRQWKALPERLFRPYHPQGDDNPNLKIARGTTQIKSCRHPVPSIVIRDETPATRQPWRVLFYKNAPGTQPHAETLDAEYRQRQHHERGYAQYVHALAGHSLPKAYEMIRTPNAQGQKRTTIATAETDQSHREVQWVAWIKCLAFDLIHDFGAAVGRPQAKQLVGTLVRRYILRPGRLYLHAGQLIVQLDPFRGDEALRPYLQQLNARRLSIPWVGNLVLQVEIAAQPEGLAATPQIVGQRILANSDAAAP